MWQDISINSFDSFIDFEDYLLQRHIMIPQTKSIRKLKLYSDCGYHLLFRDLSYPSSLLFTCEISSRQALLEKMRKAFAPWNLSSNELDDLANAHNYQKFLLTNRCKIIKSKDFEMLKKFDIFVTSYDCKDTESTLARIYWSSEFKNYRPWMNTWRYNFGTIFYGYYFFTYD